LSKVSRARGANSENFQRSGRGGDKIIVFDLQFFDDSLKILLKYFIAIKIIIFHSIEISKAGTKEKIFNLFLRLKDIFLL
jgi:hypothetical protein